jgi:hypothetical protein
MALHHQYRLVAAMTRTSVLGSALGRRNGGYTLNVIRIVEAGISDGNGSAVGNSNGLRKRGALGDGNSGCE